MENNKHLKLGKINFLLIAVGFAIIVLDKKKENFYFTEYKKTKDSELLNFLVLSNSKLVSSIVKGFVSSNISFTHEDLIQEGTIGLLKAIEKFDPSKGFKFSTYATYWIKQNIIRSLQNKESMIRKPVNVCVDISKIKKAETQLALERNIDIIPDKDILERTGLKKDHYDTLKKHLGTVYSLDNVIGNSEEDSSIKGYNIVQKNIQGSDGLVEDIALTALSKITRENFLEVIGSLTEKESTVIKMKFGFIDERIYTFNEIANYLKISVERSRQIYSKALKKLRHPSRMAKLQSAL